MTTSLTCLVKELKSVVQIKTLWSWDFTLHIFSENQRAAEGSLQAERQDIAI